MKAAKPLTKEEKAKINRLRSMGVGISPIARRIHRSSSIVRNYLIDTNNYKTLKKAIKEITEAEGQEMVRLRREGMAIYDIAKAVHRSAPHVSYYLKNIGEYEKPKRACMRDGSAFFTEEEKRQVIALRNDGMSINKIARVVKKTNIAVSDMLKEEGLYKPLKGGKPTFMLTEKQKDMIRGMREEGKAPAFIAKKLHIGPKYIKAYIDEFDHRSHIKARTKSRELTEAQKEQARELRAKGMSIAKIAGVIHKAADDVSVYLRSLDDFKELPTKPNRNIDLTVEEGERFVELRSMGMSFDFIAHELHHSLPTIYKYAKSIGMDERRKGNHAKPFTDKEKEDMRRMRSKGVSIDSIAKWINRGAVVVKRFLEEEGIYVPLNSPLSLTEAQKLQIKEMRESGELILDISKAIGRSHQYVEEYLWDNDIRKPGSQKGGVRGMVHETPSVYDYRSLEDFERDEFNGK